MADMMGNFGISINIVSSKSNLDEAIKQLQTYVDGKKLNLGLNISPDAMKGLDQLTKIIKNNYTEVDKLILEYKAATISAQEFASAGAKIFESGKLSGSDNVTLQQRAKLIQAMTQATREYDSTIAQEARVLREAIVVQNQMAESEQKLALYTDTMKNKLANLQIGKGNIFSQSGIQAEMNMFLADLALVGTVGGKSVQELNLQYQKLTTSVREAASQTSLVAREHDSFMTTITKD